MTPQLRLAVFSCPILIVDDHETTRLFLAESLKKRGFTNLVMVASASEAMHVLLTLKPELILLDLMMPGDMDGYACCQAIRREPEFVDVPIIVQTSIVEPHLRVRAFACGASDFVSKPIYPDELCARVLVHLERRMTLKTLRLYRERIRTELDSARQLQLSILPSWRELEDIKLSCGLDFSSSFQPSSEIGGDFWGVRPLFPQQTALWLADFSGHGVAAALNAFRLQAYLKEPNHNHSKPGEYLTFLNESLLRLLMRGQFATMFYGIIDSQNRQLFYACAGVPHPIILRQGDAGAQLISGAGRPLGVGLNTYQTETIPFTRGDFLILYSDALVETPDNTGKLIEEQDLLKLVASMQGHNAEDIKSEIYQYYMGHGQQNQRDDLTLVVCG